MNLERGRQGSILVFTASMETILSLLRRYLRLLAFGWPLLFCIAAAGALTNDLLLPAAVAAGSLNPLAGFAVLAALVLTKLVTVVFMFLALRPAMPSVSTLYSQRDLTSPEAGRPTQTWLPATAVAIVPFFAYYAAWGFLGDTVRDYSVLALEAMPFGRRGTILDVPRTMWLFLAVAIAFGVRKLAKVMQTRTSRPVWQFIIVLCDANWVFVGLYALADWKNAAWAWFVSGALLPYVIWLRDLLSGFIVAAEAAAATPVDLEPATFGASLQGLFFYALLPLVWLLMGAVIYGYDMKDQSSIAGHRQTAAALSVYARLPKFLREFIDHFISGYRSRYLPIANSVRLAFGAGLAPLLVFMLLYRAIGWAGAWGWIGLAHLLGPHELKAWQALASGISFFLGGPSDLRGGILIDGLRIALVAAVIEQASQHRIEASLDGRSAGSVAASPAG